MDSVPAAFALVEVDGRERFSFRSANDDPAAGTPAEGGWAGVQALELTGASSDPSRRRPAIAMQGRRLGFDDATLVTSVSRLQGALSTCRLEAAGFRQLRVWMAGGALRLKGNFGPTGGVGPRDAVANANADADSHESGHGEADAGTPFTIRITCTALAGTTRRILIGLGDVRLFGPLAVPAPILGAALAQAIASAALPTPMGILAVRGPAIELDPLEATMIFALVARGWRMPDLARGQLRSIELTGDVLRLCFSSEPPSTASGARTADVANAAWLEGEPLPYGLTDAEDLLFSGDHAGAEKVYRERVNADPGDRAAQARLLALRAAAIQAPGSMRGGPAELTALADAVVARWPDFIPGVLAGALGALAAGDAEHAAALFDQAAALAEARGETEDAALARHAAQRALRTSTGAANGTGASERSTAETPPVPLAQRRSSPEHGAHDAAADADGALDTDAGAPGTPIVDPGGAGTTEAAGAGEVTAKTAALYSGATAPEQRAEALGALLHDFERLSPARQHDAYASFGRVAESTGDLEYAEEAYWRATTVAGDPNRRADDLTAHARVLLARGNPVAAVAELDEALSLAPAHPGALALLGDRAFEGEDWARARDLYARLDRVPGADDIVPRRMLVSRRALLARAAGASDEAEACYQELADLDPQDVEARQALTELALEREDPGTAAVHLEEMLRLLPRDALEARQAARQQLGEIYVGLGDWNAACVLLDLVVAQDPRNLSALEHLAEIYDRLGQPTAAAEALDRLSRLYQQPRARALALLRSGDLLRDRLGDEGQAFDRYLRASDLDPTYPPTALRLIAGYWERGQWAEIAGVAAELQQNGGLPPLEPALRVRLTLALALDHGDAARAVEEADLGQVEWDTETAAQAFVDAAANQPETRTAEDLAPVVSVLEMWSRLSGPSADADAGPRGGSAQDPDRAHGDGGRGDSLTQAPRGLDPLWAALRSRANATPDAPPPGLVAALAWADQPLEPPSA